MLTAVRLSQHSGIQVQAVAAALYIHPFMLSKWRKQVRDVVVRGKGLDERPDRGHRGRGVEHQHRLRWSG